MYVYRKGMGFDRLHIDMHIYIKGENEVGKTGSKLGKARHISIHTPSFTYTFTISQCIFRYIINGCRKTESVVVYSSVEEYKNTLNTLSGGTSNTSNGQFMDVCARSLMTHARLYLYE